MKKSIIPGLAMIMLTTLVMNASFAQQNDVAVLRPMSKGATSNEVNAAVQQSFAEKFTAEGRVQWKKTKSEYIAEFKEGSRLTLAWFSYAGKLNTTIYYGTAESLPVKEQLLVRNQYPGYEITAATEIHRNGQVMWLITIGDFSYVKKLRIVNGDIEEVKNMNRGF